MSRRLFFIGEVPKSHFKPYTAMDRNKYICKLSVYVIIVSFTYNKGGTWSGAVENIRANWRRPMFVRSGSGVPEGNNKLLELGGESISLEGMFRNKQRKFVQPAKPL